MTPRTSRPVLLLAAVAATACLASACSDDAAARAGAPAAAPSPSPSSAPTPPPPPPVDPFTGAGPVPEGAVVALKVDNSPLARPFHRGLAEADLVYQEVMEGGATRFLAVYSPAVDVEVGPIRSMREGDVELLAQFGRVPLGASGANDGVLATFAQAAQEGKLLDANFEVAPEAYRKGERRKDAFNFFTTPAKIDAVRPGGTVPHDIGLRFGDLAPEAGFPAASASVRFSPLERVTVTYDAATGRYAVLQDGRPLNGAQPANVVVQHVKIRGSQYVDVLGNQTPYTETVGEGPAVVLRDGRRLSGYWSRPDLASGTRLLDDKRRDLPLKPGPTWFLLVPAGSELQVS